MSLKWSHRTYVVLKTSAALDRRITRSAGFLGTADQCRRSLDGTLLMLRYDNSRVPAMIDDLVSNHRDGIRAAYLTHAQAYALVSTEAWQTTPGARRR